MSKTKKKLKKKLNSMDKPLMVEWEDHFSVQGWTTNHDTDPVLVTSFGVPLKETRKVLVLAQNAIYEEGTAGVGNCIVILKNCIVSRKAIK